MNKERESLMEYELNHIVSNYKFEHVMDEFKNSNTIYLEHLSEQKDLMHNYQDLKNKFESIQEDINRIKNEMMPTIDKLVENEKSRLMNTDMSSYTNKIDSIKSELRNIEEEYKAYLKSLTDEAMLELLQEEANEVKRYRSFIDSVQVKMEERLGANSLAVINERADVQGISELTDNQIEELKEHADYMVQKLNAQLNANTIDVYKAVDVTIDGSYKAIHSISPLNADKIYLGIFGALLIATYVYAAYAIWIIAIPFIMLAANFYATYARNKKIVNEYLPLRQLSALAMSRQDQLNEAIERLRKEHIAEYQIEYNKKLTYLVNHLKVAEKEFTDFKESLLTGFDEQLFRETERNKYEEHIRLLNDDHHNTKNEAIRVSKEINKRIDLAKKYKAYNELLKEAIIIISQTQKGVGDSPYLSEFFFLGIDDDNNRSMNFEWGMKANIVVYDDEEPNIDKTIVSVNTNIILQMLLYTNPTKFTPYIIDNKEGGIQYTKFLASHELGIDKFFERITTTQASRVLVEDLFDRQESVISKLLTHASDIHNFNRGRYQIGSTTENYSILFFINYEPSILTDERLKQVILNSYRIGIVPIFYIPKSSLNGILNLSKDEAKTYGEVFNTITEGQVYLLQGGKFLRYSVRNEETNEAECVSVGVKTCLEEIINLEKGD